jgi:hypothetical protein
MFCSILIVAFQPRTEIKRMKRWKGEVVVPFPSRERQISSCRLQSSVSMYAVEVFVVIALNYLPIDWTYGMIEKQQQPTAHSKILSRVSPVEKFIF